MGYIERKRQRVKERQIKKTIYPNIIQITDTRTGHISFIVKINAEGVHFAKVVLDLGTAIKIRDKGLKLINEHHEKI